MISRISLQWRSVPRHAKVTIVVDAHSGSHTVHFADIQSVRVYLAVCVVLTVHAVKMNLVSQSEKQDSDMRTYRAKVQHKFRPGQL
jgi:hypothetical protein